MSPRALAIEPDGTDGLRERAPSEWAVPGVSEVAAQHTAIRIDAALVVGRTSHIRPRPTATGLWADYYNQLANTKTKSDFLALDRRQLPKAQQNAPVVIRAALGLPKRD